MLTRSFDHYAYLASAAAVGVVAQAWSRCPRGARRGLLVLATIACVHGGLVMLRMRTVGTIEQRFHGELAAWLQRNEGAVHVAASRAADSWMLERWVDDVPSYRGVAIAGRATTNAAPPGAAELTMQPDGTLAAAKSTAR